MSSFAQLIIEADKAMEDLIIDHFDLSAALREAQRIPTIDGKHIITMFLPNDTHTQYLFLAISKMIAQQQNKKNDIP